MKYLNRIKIILTFLFLMVPISLIAGCHSDEMGHWHPGHGFHWFFGFGGGLIMMIIKIIILVLLIIWGFKMINSSIKSILPNHSKEQDPLTILKTRYAKGEINKEEFNEMKKDM
jgi:putative membrane protein